MSALPLEVLNAHKDPDFAATLNLFDRDLVLLISHAYDRDKEPEDMNVADLRLFDRMFNEQGLIRRDRVPTGEAATIQIPGIDCPIRYIGIKNITIITYEQRLAMRDGLITNEEVNGMTMLCIRASPLPPQDSSTAPLTGLCESAFDLKKAFKIAVEDLRGWNEGAQEYWADQTDDDASIGEREYDAQTSAYSRRA